MEAYQVTQSDQLKQQVKVFYAQITLQKSLRLTLRAIWMGLAGVLICWAANALWGYLPNPLTWFSIGLAVALLPIMVVIFSLYPVLTDLPPPLRWIYAIDSHLNQHGQISTAWEIAQISQSGPVADLLVQDMLAFLPGARAQILKGGWVSKRDLAAAGVAALMSFLLLAATLLQPGSQPAVVPSAPVIPQTAQEQSLSPALEQQSNEPGAQPGASQNGENGSQDGNNPGDSAAGGETSTGAIPDSASGADPGSVADALRQLGKELSQQAGTYDLGEALENLEMNIAADALEDVTNQVDDLSTESRENMSQALEDAANNMNGANSPSIAEDMQGAADALREPGAAPEEALGEVAEDFRQLDGPMQAMEAGGGDGAGQGESAGAEQANPADRLPNESGQMEIPLENSDLSDLLSPADPDAPAEGTASGSLDANRPQQNPTNQSPLLPNSFLWKWRNVVSQYFQR